ncbi:carboxypeptidase-like regulatory domain-containing protein [Flavobacterium sp. J27]|uniref:carboxypeptidase-like regulatory domain-containing protein n=1 Tax=Flavobacterium sp. J27 TaxID=2060419 RepID=UPI0010313435|nr:carboxypeptidase-like regulatory domain-containing protein [Flavobacterium sp. J27]
MKTVILFFLVAVNTICSQVTIEGFVIDNNQLPLLGASVYIDGTTIGTTTDDKGYFILTVPSTINSVIVISYFGFITQYIPIESTQKKLNIILSEEVKALKEIVVQQSPFSRKQMLQFFREQFLGTNKAGSNCVIENEEEIYFDYDSKNFVFKAYSDKPLLITNNYLSYKINYQLVDFQCKFYKISLKTSDMLSSLYAGTSFFTAIENEKKFLKRRVASYQGSSLHFFRNLVAKKWGKDEFVLFEGSFITNPDEHFVISKDKNNAFYRVDVTKQNKSLTKKGFVAEFSILYDNKEQSKISFFTDTFFVDRFGLFSNYNAIYFSGDITKRKIGDLLPSDYGL